MVTALDFIDNNWRVKMATGESIIATHVVLAIGSSPRVLDYTHPEKVIPFVAGLDKDLLAQLVVPEDTVAVVGSAHSAVLILKNLSELPVGRIVNFYRHPFVYPIDMGGWIYNEQSGLKGLAARWAKDVLEKNPPENLIRVLNTPRHRAAWLRICTKIIYAIGFDRNTSIVVNGDADITYDDHTGQIGTRLFGIGIAFPEKYTNPIGGSESRVGLPFFIDYALRIIPQWINSRHILAQEEEYRAAKEKVEKLKEFDELLEIFAL